MNRTARALFLSGVAPLALAAALACKPAPHQPPTQHPTGSTSSWTKSAPPTSRPSYTSSKTLTPSATVSSSTSKPLSQPPSASATQSSYTAPTCVPGSILIDGQCRLNHPPTLPFTKASTVVSASIPAPSPSSASIVIAVDSSAASTSAPPVVTGSLADTGPRGAGWLVIAGLALITSGALAWWSGASGRRQRTR